MFPLSPLAAVLGMLAATVAGGSFLVAATVIGLLGWPAVLLALVLAALAALVLGPALEWAIKRADPAWDELRDRPNPLMLPVRSRDDPSRFDPRRHWRR